MVARQVSILYKALVLSNMITKGTKLSGSAKIVSLNEYRLLVTRMECRRHALRDTAILLLSFKAGLRACEIAGLDWSMVTKGSGGIANTISVGRGIAKNGRPRRLPMHPKLRAALIALRLQEGQPRRGPVIRSQRGGHLTPGSVVNWFSAFYVSAGLYGCSSHSGRRTFITNSARLLAKVGGSLRDIQELAGHSALTTTEAYLHGDRDIQRKLVRLL